VGTKRKTEISLEIEEAVALRTHTVLLAHCPACRKQMRMVAANDAAIIVRRSAREIYQLVESGKLHFIEDQNGLLYVCSDSLDQQCRSRRIL
jgi:hypothetical protein